MRNSYMGNSMVKKVVIFFSDTGGGHRAAAKAVQSILDTNYPRQYTIRIVDGFGEGVVWPVSQFSQLYPMLMKHAPSLWGKLYDVSNHPIVARVVKWLIDRAIYSRARDILVKEGPDLVVNTHPLMGFSIRKALEKEFDQPIPMVTVATDLFNPHRLWFLGEPDLCIVANEASGKQAIDLGLNSERVRAIGLPINQSFFSPKRLDKEGMRRKLRLHPKKPTVLIMGGGDGIGKIRQITEALSETYAPIQLMVVSGRNKKLKEELELGKWNIPIKVFGFVTNIHELMIASDLLITKAGPATITEAISCGLPMIVMSFFPGQEERNVEFVVKHGVGDFIESPDLIAKTAKRYCTLNRKVLRDMSLKSRGLVKPGIAMEIGELLHKAARV